MMFSPKKDSLKLSLREYYIVFVGETVSIQEI